MSIEYFAARARERDRLRVAVESGSADLPPIERTMVSTALTEALPAFTRYELDYAEIARFDGTTEEEARARYRGIEMNWEDPGDGGYVQVVIQPDHVTVHTGGGESVIVATEAVVNCLIACGLHVYDPQNDDWL